MSDVAWPWVVALVGVAALGGWAFADRKPHDSKPTSPVEPKAELKVEDELRFLTPIETGTPIVYLYDENNGAAWLMDPKGIRRLPMDGPRARLETKDQKLRDKGAADAREEMEAEAEASRESSPDAYR